MKLNNDKELYRVNEVLISLDIWKQLSHDEKQILLYGTDEQVKAVADVIFDRFSGYDI
ncbi:hypothetical protein AALA22_15555 [Anaerovoracaceae bacterium 41-7]